ncbi:MAG: sigma-70 family RNA polymerase sigma factor [Armatimonadetes bacterium]|nr:sigma-70 family RNA polymerase sigma factor [Armatimonadota bacterium]
MIATLLFLLALITGRRDLEHANDRMLVHLTARGETRALEVLHKRYYTRLYKLAFMKLGHEDDAHDIASEAFVRAVRNVFKLDPLSSASLYPWLHTVVGNLVVDLYRRRAQIETVSDTPDLDDLVSLFERLEDEGPLPEEIVARKQTQNAVREALAHLPETQAQAVYLRFIGELSLLEIGDVMGKSEGAIKSLLHRGMLSLRARVEAMAEQRRTKTRAGKVTDANGDTLSVHRGTPGGA